MKKSILLAFIFLVPATSAPAFSPLFYAELSYHAGGYPHSVSSGDFDEDGHTDLAVANFESDDVSILLGSGNGIFSSAVNYGVGDWPYSVATGDFDEDGHADLAVTNYYSNNVSMLIGNGDGAFASSVNFDTGYGPRAVITGDFDANGHIDLAVANNSSADISILLGVGGGTFISDVNYGSVYGSISLITGDYNEDGYADLAVAGDVGVSILINLSGDPTGAKEIPSSPVVFNLLANYPNPFNPTTNIKFSVQKAGRVIISVYDVTGQKVRELVNRNYERGEFKTIWDGKNSDNQPVGSGVYFVRMIAGNYKAVGKMVLIR